MFIEMLATIFVLVYQMNEQSLILLPIQSTFNCSPTWEKEISEYLSRNHLVRTEERNSVIGSRHAFWLDHDGRIVSADIIDETKLHCPVPQNETNAHLSFSPPRSPTVWNGQSNMKTLDGCLAQWESNHTCQSNEQYKWCVRALNETSCSDVSVESTTWSIELSFKKSFRHATLPLSALGYSKKPTCNTVACLHPSFNFFPADICTIIRKLVAPQKDFFICHVMLNC